MAPGMNLAQFIEKKCSYMLDMENRQFLAARPEFLFGTLQEWQAALASAAKALPSFDEWLAVPD